MHEQGNPDQRELDQPDGGPIGQMLGLFASHLDRQTLDAIHRALCEAAAHEWEQANAEETTERRSYHVARWGAFTQGADFVALIAGDTTPQVTS
jgi:hypothetical protein